ADTGKRAEYETALAAGDALSAHFHDFDWADEVLHAQIGRRWLKQEGIGREEAIRRGDEIHARTELDPRLMKAVADMGFETQAPQALVLPDRALEPAGPGAGGAAAGRAG